jgi:hypothetical protein
VIFDLNTKNDIAPPAMALPWRIASNTWIQNKRRGARSLERLDERTAQAQVAAGRAR